jgi:cytochrome c
MQGMMGMGAGVQSLKSVPASAQVKAITYCEDTYNVMTADGKTVQFWERNLRFKTDSSEDGPLKGAPAIVGAGMAGDRSSVIFAAPEEIGQFIKRQC